MPRDPGLARWAPVDDSLDRGAGYGPLDADLQALDAELLDAGTRGRRALNGRTQPTRFFANALRDRLFRPPRGRSTGR